MQDTNDPGQQDQQRAQPGAHYDCVMQRVTDGHIAVIGHHTQEQVVQFCKNQEEAHLGDAVSVGDVPAPCLDVHQHLWDCGGGEADVHKGQVGEEEVHGRVQVRLGGNGHGDEQVPKHCDQVHGQEQCKHKVWAFCTLSLRKAPVERAAEAVKQTTQHK